MLNQMSSPQVSVVMSVYNDAAYLPAALGGILEQQGVDFELIVVNDGSSDGSGAILAEFANRDSRLRVIDQPNAGLTAALIQGCRLARGQYIARHDSDDVSLPGRLARQVAFLEANPRAALVSCTTQYVGPADEPMHATHGPAALDAATARLRAADPAQVLSPNHGSVMFRRASYERVGGYRAEFRYAQDLDLWTRLTDTELLGYLPDVLYLQRVRSNSISMTLTATQRELAAVIVSCREARASGGDECSLLQRAAAICRAAKSAAGNQFAGDYFLGRVLLDRGNPAAVTYLRRAVRANPWSLKARLALASARLIKLRRGAISSTTTPPSTSELTK